MAPGDPGNSPGMESHRGHMQHYRGVVWVNVNPSRPLDVHLISKLSEEIFEDDTMSVLLDVCSIEGFDPNHPVDWMSLIELVTNVADSVWQNGEKAVVAIISSGGAKLDSEAAFGELLQKEGYKVCLVSDQDQVKIFEAYEFDHVSEFNSFALKQLMTTGFEGVHLARAASGRRHNM